MLQNVGILVILVYLKPVCLERLLGSWRHIKHVARQGGVGGGDQDSRTVKETPSK